MGFQSPTCRRATPFFFPLRLPGLKYLGAGHIFIGANAIDYSGYPDCRPEFIALFETLANIGTKAGVEGARFRIHAPLLTLSKAAIIRKARELDLDLALTHSCYDPSPEGLACGLCDSCQLRLKGFREAGLTDPIQYACPPIWRNLITLGNIFVLTKREQRVVIAIVLALLAGTIAKYEWTAHSRPLPLNPTETAATPPAAHRAR